VEVEGRSLVFNRGRVRFDGLDDAEAARAHLA
jgi:hypothetical protein